MKIDASWQVGFGKPLVVGPTVGLQLGYDAATGFDLARQCGVNVSEEDGRQWAGSCSDQSAPCRLTNPVFENGEFSATLLCRGMDSSDSEIGQQADLTAVDDATAGFSIQIAGCTEPVGD